MNKEEMLTKMKAAIANGDIESAHMDLDTLLLEYINDEDITELFGSAPKWYA